MSTAKTRAGNVTVSQEDYEALQRRLEAFEALQQQQTNSFWRLHVVPIAKILWKSRFAWFVAGVLLTAVVLPNFTVGGAAWWRMAPIQLSTVSPSSIAKSAPNSTERDKNNRSRLIQVCRRIAEQIRLGAITKRSDAMTELANGTISLQSGKWESVCDALDVYLSKAGNLDELAERFEQVVQAFEE